MVPQLITPPVPLLDVLYLVDLDISGLAQITGWATGESVCHIWQGCKVCSSKERQNRLWQQTNFLCNWYRVFFILGAKFRTREVVSILRDTCSLFVDKWDTEIILPTDIPFWLILSFLFSFFLSFLVWPLVPTHGRCRAGSLYPFLYHGLFRESCATNGPLSE